MKNRREFGIYFRKGSDCGIAKIIVLDNTIDRYITSTGAQSETLAYRLVDTYLPSSGYTALEKDFVYWIPLEDDHDYDITVENSGTHNSAAESPYNINIIKYFDTKKWDDGSVIKVVRLWHSDHESDYFEITLSSGSNTLIRTTTASGDGVSKVFSVGGVSHSNGLYRVSSDGGSTWMYEYDPYITWGSNSPTFDDEMVDANGHFSVNFVSPPPYGISNIIIQWTPKVDRYKIISTVSNPSAEDGSVVDLKSNVRELDYSLEFKA
jgi:hypothetical protein